MAKPPGMPWIIRKERSGEAVCNGDPTAKAGVNNRSAATGRNPETVPAMARNMVPTRPSHRAVRVQNPW